MVNINRKLVLLISFIILIIAVVIVVFITKESNQLKQEVSTTSSAVDNTNGSNIYDQLFPVLDSNKKVINNLVQLPSLDTSNNLLYFFNRENKPGIYSYNLVNQEKKLQIAIDDINSIFYPPDYSKIIFSVIYNEKRFEKYQSPFLSKGVKDGELTYWYYDFSSRQLKKLNRNIQSLFWLNSNEIIFHYFDWNKSPEENYLGKIDIVSFKSEKIVDIDYYQTDFISAQPNKVLLQDQPTEYPATSPLLTLDLSTKIITPLLENRDFVGGKSSPDNRFLSLFSYNEQENNFNLEVYDQIDNKLIESGISTEKTLSTWSKDNTVYLVVEKNNHTSISSYNPIENKVRQLNIEVPKDVVIDEILFFSNKIYLLANNFIYQYDI